MATIFGVWQATIRPAVEWVFHILVSVPLSWFGVDFEMPLWARDYISVGVILAFIQFVVRAVTNPFGFPIGRKWKKPYKLSEAKAQAVEFWLMMAEDFPVVSELVESAQALEPSRPSRVHTSISKARRIIRWPVF